MSLILQGINLPSDGKTITVDIDSNGVAWVSNKGEWDKHQAIQVSEADEWCHDCKEYDQENHCCPRFNRVIKKTMEELLVRVEAKKNEGLYLETDEDTLLETEYIVLRTDGMYKMYVHENE